MNLAMYNRIPYIIIGACFGYKISWAHCESQRLCHSKPPKNCIICYFSTCFNINLGIFIGMAIGDYYARRVAYMFS